MHRPQTPSSGFDRNRASAILLRSRTRHRRPIPRILPSQNLMASSTGSAGGSSGSEAWRNETDPNERRKIQNKLAQRKFRQKAKENREEAERQVANQQNASASYQPAQATDITRQTEYSGLPWGGVNMQHVYSGQQQSSTQSYQGSSAGDSNTTTNNNQSSTTSR